MKLKDYDQMIEYFDEEIQYHQRKIERRLESVHVATLGVEREFGDILPVENLMLMSSGVIMDLAECKQFIDTLEDQKQRLVNLNIRMGKEEAIKQYFINLQTYITTRYSFDNNSTSQASNLMNAWAFTAIKDILSELFVRENI